jgi:hypothetical protein
MPNVLLTFEEIADLFHCDSAGARSLVIQNQWERRRWADGLPRVQVPREVAHQFMLHYAAKFEHPPTHEPDAEMISVPVASGGCSAIPKKPSRSAARPPEWKGAH